MIHLLYSALATDLGVVVTSPDVPRLRAKLYQLRAEARDPDLAPLAFIPSPTSPTELWIVRREPAAAVDLASLGLSE